MAAAPLLITIPSVMVPSWPKRKTAKVQPAIRLDAALERRWPTDEHAFQYTHLQPGTTANGDPGWYRYSNAAPQTPHGNHLYLTTSFVDLDLPEHAAWDDVEGDPHAAVGELVAMFPDAAVYSTRAGARLVWVLARPVPIDLANSWLKAWGLELAERTMPQGLELDRACFQWTRPFRLPRVTREGVALDPELDTSAIHQGRRLAWTPPEAPESQGTTTQDLVEMPGMPLELAELRPDWPAFASGQSLQVLDLLLQGRPWGPPEVPMGTRNPRLKQAVNSMTFGAYQAGWRMTPGEAFAIFAPSVEAELKRDPTAPPMSKLWHFCAYSSPAMAAKFPPPDNTHPPVITLGGSAVVVWDPDVGTYRGPFRGHDIHLGIREYQPTISTYRASGASLMPVNQLIDLHATPANTLRATYPGSTIDPWDAGGRQVTLETFAPSAVVPVHDPEVATWLEALAGPYLGTLLDWLATAHRLHEPTAALYLQGPPGIGKGMLANAVAHMWRGAPVSFKHVLGSFQADLLRNPVVFLDEGVKLSSEVASTFRSLVAESTHNVERKHLPSTSLVGCPRVIIAANHGKAIQLAGGAKSVEDLEAIIQRILHVPAQLAAGEYLEGLGGRAYTTRRDWVVGDQGPGRIPGHIAWLQAEREVVPGSRFLVQGLRSAYHIKLVTSDPLFGQLLITILGAIAPTGRPPGGPGVFCAGDGLVRVNPRALHTRWHELHIEDAPKPQAQVIAAGLGALSHAEDIEEWTVDGVESYFWPIDGDLLMRTARDLGFPNIQRIRDTLRLGTANAPSKAPGTPTH